MRRPAGGVLRALLLAGAPANADEAVLAWPLEDSFRETADSFALLRPPIVQSAVFAGPY
jgi:hypothetical protein